MKKTVLLFGLLTGAIVSANMLIMVSLLCNNPGMETNDWLGFAALFLIFSLILVGIKRYRDKYANGIISFWKAFQVGLLIALIASTMYVLAWLVDYYLFVPDFIDRYTEHVLLSAQNKGATPEVLEAKAKEMAEFKETYKNPIVVILYTYMEVLPIGILISLVGAVIFRRKALPVQA